MNELLPLSETLRLTVASETNRTHKSNLGQFMTPAATAEFMASLLDLSSPQISLVDPGAGLGALTCAVVDRWQKVRRSNDQLSIVAQELDDDLRQHLENTLLTGAFDGYRVDVRSGDYLREAVASILKGEAPYTHAIINPPYKKIGVSSDARLCMQDLGLTVVNLYAAFVGAALAQLKVGGQLVAIIPRSFCNGPYYKNFREWILGKSAIERVHLFESRTKAFKDDAVLQENLIILLRRGGEQGNVVISTSSDDSFSDVRERTVNFAAVVKPDDVDVFFHVSMDSAEGALETAPNIKASLAQIGLMVSTGPVVSFRTRDHLRAEPIPGSVPMIYPAHFKDFGLVWPIENKKKSNAIDVNSETARWLFPGTGLYVAVRRMSSKEERRRVNAVLVDPARLGRPHSLGFDNGLNIIHQNKGPLEPDIAYGLVAFLNSSAVDQHFRRFNGHTQVNAADLRNIPYPSRADLSSLGAWARGHGALTPAAIDSKMDELLEGSTHPMDKDHRIAEALAVLKVLDFPRAQINDRSALCLLALLDLSADQSWDAAENPLIGITPIMNWVREHYDRPYAPNTRETFRRQSMHQFVASGLVLYNPDKLDRAVNSPAAVYQIAPEALTLLRKHGSPHWASALATYQQDRIGLAERYAKARDMNLIPVTIPGGAVLELSAGDHSTLIAAIIEQFGPRFAPGADLIYAGDTGQKMGYFNEEQLGALGVVIDQHGKMPDVILYDRQRNWLLLIEAVTSHGPVDGKRHNELARLFANCSAGLVYVTAFLGRKAMSKYVTDIAWETEVWVAEAPDHLIHFNGDRYLGPHA